MRRETLLRVERVRPAKPLFPDRALVRAEQLQDLALVGVDDEKPGIHQRRQDGDGDGGDDPGRVVGFDAQVDAEQRRQVDRQQDDDDSPPRANGPLFLTNHRAASV